MTIASLIMEHTRSLPIANKDILLKYLLQLIREKDEPDVIDINHCHKFDIERVRTLTKLKFRPADFEILIEWFNIPLH